MISNNKNTHLTLSERSIIEVGINNGSTKKSLADTIGKDPTTIAKEIRNHRELKHKCAMNLECANYKHCKYGRNCNLNCTDYKPFKCSRRDKSPGACNGCPNYNHCRMDKYFYNAANAEHQYCETLVNSRIGLDTTIGELKRIGIILEPLLKNGQSLEQIMCSHKNEIQCSIKTLYKYIESNVFKDLGFEIDSMSLRRVVTRKINKRVANQYKPRNNQKYLKNRLYKDYKEYLNENPDISVVQMDTVYNDFTNGPFIQTFKFMKYGFMLAFLHDDKTAESMNNGILKLENILGPNLFNDLVQVILTDRGSEFVKLPEIEMRPDNSRRTRVFYCDPMSAGQKGSLENKHEELRYILPKQVNLTNLGLTSQDKLNIVISHINSSPRKMLNYKSSIELIQFLNPQLWISLSKFGIKKINKDKINLTPSLIK